MARFVELRRHTDNEGDALTTRGVSDALDIGSRLSGGYSLAASSGAQRATQTLACFLAALAEPIPGGVIVETRLRSDVEERWRSAYSVAGAGDLESLRTADPELVSADSARLATGLGAVLALLEHGEMALAVGHSPTNEAAVFGLTGTDIDPMAKGEGVLVIAEANGIRVEPIR